MKMTRQALKALVKEALVEILQEGLGNHLAVSAPQSRQNLGEQRRIQPRPTAHSRFNPALDTPVNGSRRPTSALGEAVTREAAGNPIMESIFADTARTTLPTMIANGDSGGQGGSSSPGPTQQEQFHGAPEEVFGEEVASRWANLAFTDPQAKKTA